MFSLVDYCLLFADHNADAILKADSFTSLSATNIIQMISRNTFYIKEFDKFLALQKWVQHNNLLVNDFDALPQDVSTSSDDVNVSFTNMSQNERNLSRDQWSEILRHVRLTLMTPDELFDFVYPSGFFPPDAILGAIMERRKSFMYSYSRQPASLLEDVNVAMVNVELRIKTTKLIEGNTGITMLRMSKEDAKTYESIRIDSIWHAINAETSGIMVELEAPYVINHIRMSLYDPGAKTSYSYYVEVSQDKGKWMRVCDYRQYLCHGLQKLFFTPTETRYIRIVGTRNTTNRVFVATNLEAMFTTEQFQSDSITGVIKPSYNVATINDSCRLIGGFNYDAMINEYILNNTCYEIGDSSIVLQFTQPYLIDSLRMPVNDGNYSYYVETSVDQNQWRIVVDRRSEACESKENIQFDQPVVACFFRITGNRSTDLLCVICHHLECPIAP